VGSSAANLFLIVVPVVARAVLVAVRKADPADAVPCIQRGVSPVVRAALVDVPALADPVPALGSALVAALADLVPLVA
jgi:hypothetical protein